MTTKSALAPDCEQAIESVLALGRESTPSLRLKQLTIPAHLDFLEHLAHAIWQADHLLRATIRFAVEHVTLWESLGDLAPAIHADIVRAIRQAHLADISPAVDQVRLHMRRRDSQASPRPPRGPLGRLAQQAGADISALADAVPSSGSIEDMRLLLDAGCNVLAALAATCGHEAELIDAAYESTGIGRWAAPVHEILADAQSTLSHANTSLLAAHATAQQAAKPKRRRA